MRKDGVYLQILPGKEYAMPVTLKNNANPDGTGFEIVASVEGVRLVSNLEPGTELIPMVAMTAVRIAALEQLIEAAKRDPASAETFMARKTMRALIEETKPDSV